MKYFDNNTWFWTFIGGLFFIPFLGGVHLFDWDEINFAELAREMTVTGDFLRMQINYERFTEKPPLFFWLQAISMTIFGVGDYAARFPNALLGIIVLPFLYISGKFLIDRRFGNFWALSWFGSILPFLYFKSAIIDPWFNFFIFNGLFFLIHFIWKKMRYRDLYFSRSAVAYLWLAGISTGLAILTKGPVGFLIIVLCLGVYWIMRRFKMFISLGSFVKFCCIAFAVTLVWFGTDAIVNGPDFIVEFTIRQWELLTTSDAGHGGFPGYHLVVLLLGCFPASIFALRGLGKFSGLPSHIKDFQQWMIILLAVILILFSLVGTKIVHYSSMAYYPISFLSALAIWNIVEKHGTYKKWFSVMLIFIGILLFLISVLFPWAGTHLEDIRQLFKGDPFAYANLSAEINWDVWDYIPAAIALLNIVLFVSLVGRHHSKAVKPLFYGNAIWVMVTLIFFIGKVEKISQNAAVEFFTDQQGEEVYVTTYDYKSYVPWYYGRVMPYDNPRAQDQEWLLYGDVDRPVMISCKITAHQKLEKNLMDAQFLYEKNGFYFYRRDPQEYRSSAFNTSSNTEKVLSAVTDLE